MSQASDEHVMRILEACFLAMDAGEDPDLQTLCGGDAALIRRVGSLIERERESLDGVRAASRFSPDPGLPEGDMPRRIGDFRVIEPLGLGGMSTVYRARQDALQRDVALKVLRPELVATETGRIRFEREASITASLSHPNIVPVYAAGVADGYVYLAMKLLRGRSLDRESGRKSPRDVAKIGISIAGALQAAHDIGVVHRDVKPANVVIEDGTAFLVDFGLSSFSQSSGTITRPDTTPGTLAYLAPELARRQGGGLDPRVDVYGLGATLYEALAGQPPFGGNSPIEVLHRILHSEPHPLRLQGVNRDLETIVLRAMDKDPSKRFPTAAELGAELQRWIEGVPIRSRPVGPGERVWRLARRRPLPAALVVVIIALMMVMTVTEWRRHRGRLALREQAQSSWVTAIEDANLVSAKEQLSRLDALGAPEEAMQRMRIRTQIEELSTDLTIVLHSPLSHEDPGQMRDLVLELERLAAPNCPVRTDFVLALASRMIEESSVAHRALSVATRESLPRATAALAAWGEGRPVPAELPMPVKRGDPFDHLFTALVMRLRGEPYMRADQELRSAVAEGAAADAISFALTWILEAYGQSERVETAAFSLQSAFDMSLRLIEQPSYRMVAGMQCARMAARMGKSELALMHLRAARQPAPKHLRQLQELTELEVLLEVDSSAFAERWPQLESSLGHLPHYWLRGGDYESTRLREDPGAILRSQSHLLRARGLAKRSAIVQSVDVFALDLERRALELDGGDSNAILRRWAELSKRAESFAASARGTYVERNFQPLGWLLASEAAFSAQDRARAWRLLDVAAGYGDLPAAQARYAVLVGERILQWHFDENGRPLPSTSSVDFDEVNDGPLDAAAGKALIRARSVLASGRGSSKEGILREARLGALLSAFHLGEPAITLPIVCDWPNDPEDAALEPIVACCRAEGGLRLDQWLPDGAPLPVRTATRLLDALNTLQKLQTAGKFPAADVRAVLARWRARPAFQATAERTESDWQAVWQRLRELEAALPAK
jgi:serine/threonine-protein kinase